MHTQGDRVRSGELRVRLFAALREEAGWQERLLAHQDGMTARVLWQVLQLGGGDPPATVRIAINQEVAALDSELAPGDEVAFLPPISGG
jgi:molybdopterin synthase sulfur carrier subunit